MEKTSTERIIFLEGKKVILRPLDTKCDVPKLTQWINDPEIRGFIMNAFPLDALAEENWLKSKSGNRNDIVLAIDDRETGKFIGNMGLHAIDYIHGIATTGAIIGEKEYWNKGYGRDAKMQLLYYAFMTLNLRKICSSVKDFNKRSYKYNLACGYVKEGVRKKQLYIDGRYCDEILLAVFREDWLKLWKEYNK